jgi:hypothetical protein
MFVDGAMDLATAHPLIVPLEDKSVHEIWDLAIWTRMIGNRLAEIDSKSCQINRYIKGQPAPC